MCPDQQGQGVGLPEEATRYAAEALGLLDKWKTYMEDVKGIGWTAENSDQITQRGSADYVAGHTFVLSLSDLNAIALCLQKVHSYLEIYGKLPTSGVLVGWLQSLDASAAAIISTVLSLLIAMDCSILNSSGKISEVGAILKQLEPDRTERPSAPPVTLPSTSLKTTPSTTSTEKRKRGKKASAGTPGRSGKKPSKRRAERSRKAPKKKKKKRGKR